MLKADYTKHFKKDYKKCKKRGMDETVINKIIRLLIEEKSLPPKYKEHPLKGEYAGFLECHIQPDWLLIYKVNAKNREIIFTRTGTHSDLFK